MPTPFLNAPARTAANNLAPKEAHEPAPRCTLATAESYRTGQDITVVVKPVDVDDKEVTVECLVSGIQTRVLIPDTDVLTMNVEVTLRYRTSFAGGKDEVEYDLISCGQMNDDFNIEKYKEFLKVVEKFPNLFY